MKRNQYPWPPLPPRPELFGSILTSTRPLNNDTRQRLFDAKWAEHQKRAAISPQGAPDQHPTSPSGVGIQARSFFSSMLRLT